VMSRAIGVMLSFETSRNPFMDKPTYRALKDLPFHEKIAELRRPEIRNKILAESKAPPFSLDWESHWHMTFPLLDPPDYEPAPEQSIAALAGRIGVAAAAYCYDEMLKDDGRRMLYLAMVNYADGSLEAVLEMMQHPNTIMGLADGGAHVSVVCDSSAPTTTLTHWARDRRRGQRMPLPFLVKRLTRDCALAVGLADRGLLAPGLKADINVIDFSRLGVRAPCVVYDLPARGKRLSQPGHGYVATILSGIPVRLGDVPTGELPGRLIRGSQPDRRPSA
jgi:N-acyl-D-aspartate/D-glutamate deacylase